jgi:hypothetical protein
VTLLRLTLALLAAVAAAGCGGSDASRDARTPGVSPQATVANGGSGANGAPASGQVEADDERVIREWSSALRRGDVKAASRYFRVPSSVANGGDPLTLRTRSAVRYFNRTLPCGAKLIETAPGRAGFVEATFRLTERPGKGTCAGGAGGTARVAFLIKKGLIIYWIRIPDGGAESDTGSAS